MSDIRIQNRLMLPQRQATDLAAVAKTMASVDLSGLYPQNELWEITVARGQSRYDVRNAVGAKMARVPAVGPAANRLLVGQVAIVGYYDRDRRRPYIKAAGGFTNWEAVVEQLILGRWIQPESGQGLAYFAVSNIVDPDAASSTLFGEGAANASQYLGITVDVDGYATFAQMIRNAGNTAWEKMRLIDMLPITGPEDPAYSFTECATSISPVITISGDTFISGDRDFTLIVIPSLGRPEDRQLFRRNGNRFEEIFLLDLEDQGLYSVSVSPRGYLAIPGYAYHGIDTYRIFDPFGSSTVEYSDISTDYSHKVNAWQTKSVVTSQPKLWSLDVGEALGYPRKKVFSVSGFLSRMPGSSDGRTFVTWVSGYPMIADSELIPFLLGYRIINTGAPLYYGFRDDICRELKACIVGVSAATGAIDWTHEITATAALPVVDSGMLANFESYLGTLSGFDLGDDAAATYGGMATNLGHLSNGTAPFTTPTNEHEPAEYPDYEIFCRAGIVGLPYAANDTIARYVLGVLDTLSTFGSYVTAESASYDIEQNPKLYGDEFGNYYFAYLVPETYLTPGQCGHIVESRFADWKGALVEVRDYPGDNLYHRPGMANCYRRHIRKISSTGSLLASAEIVQEQTANWAELTHLLNLSLEPGTDVLSGESSDGWPLGDNLWSLFPCGRVVFVLLDYHDLGPTYNPATVLEIRSAEDLSVLHTISLRTSDDVTTDDVLDEAEEVVHYAGNRQFRIVGNLLGGRVGVKNVWEWGLFWLTEEDITTGTQSTRLMRVEMGGVLEDAPTITYPSATLPRNTTIVSDGYLLTPEVLGTITVINAIG